MNTYDDISAIAKVTYPGLHTHAGLAPATSPRPTLPSILDETRMSAQSMEAIAERLRVIAQTLGCMPPPAGPERSMDASPASSFIDAMSSTQNAQARALSQMRVYVEMLENAVGCG